MQLVQIQLGIFPFAAAGVLGLVRPRLPSWLPDVTLHGLRVGDARVSLRFRRRDDGGVEHTVIERAGRLRLVEVPPPADVHGEAEPLHDRLLRWGLDHLPGTTARAMRIAIGVER